MDMLHGWTTALGRVRARHVACGMWHVACGMWHVVCCMSCVLYDACCVLHIGVSCLYVRMLYVLHFLQVMLLFQALSTSTTDPASTTLPMSAEWAHALRTAELDPPTSATARSTSTLSLRSLSGSLPYLHPAATSTCASTSSASASPATFTSTSYRKLRKRPLELSSPHHDMSPSLVRAESSSPCTPDHDPELMTHLSSDPASRMGSTSPFAWMHTDTHNAMSSDDEQEQRIMHAQEQRIMHAQARRKRQRTNSVLMAPAQSVSSAAPVQMATSSLSSLPIHPYPPTAMFHSYTAALPSHVASHPHAAAPSHALDADDEMHDMDDIASASSAPAQSQAQSHASLPSFPHFPVSCFPQQPLPLSHAHSHTQSASMFHT